MRQRAMIAMALMCQPAILIADEPTTALDVTTQANILSLMKGLQSQFDMGILLITHDLGVVANVADDVAVMYRGEIVERGDVEAIFRDARHPYLKALMRCVPKVDGTAQGAPDPAARHAAGQPDVPRRNRKSVRNNGAPVLEVENVSKTFWKRGGPFSAGLSRRRADQGELDSSSAAKRSASSANRVRARRRSRRSSCAPWRPTRAACSTTRAPARATSPPSKARS